MAANPKLPVALALVAAASALGAGAWWRLKPRAVAGHPFAMNVRSLEGASLGAEAFQGKPWVINLWRPG